MPPSSSTGWCAECDAREFRKREEKRRWLRSSRMYQTEVDEMYALREKVANPGAPMSEGETYRLLALEEKARRLGILEEGGHAE